MTSTRVLLGLALAAALTTGCPAGDEKPSPGITAQGFELAQPREAAPGEFSNVRIRFEVPAGIEHLVVRERSFEIDLAKSPEAMRFPLFGIERRVWSKRDVTLDFSGYLNEKIQHPGEYALVVEVVDRDARETSATLQIVVTEPEMEAEDDDAVEPSVEAEESVGADAEDAPAAASADTTASSADAPPLSEERPFRLQRVGAGPVEGGERFGITWKTVDAIDVVIRMAASDAQPGRLARLDPMADGRLSTRDDLNRALGQVDLADALEVPTANGAAGGALLAVVRPGERYLLRTDHSTTSLSELGTTVTLSGRYRESVRRR